MKHVLLITAALAVVVTPPVAQAQQNVAYGGREAADGAVPRDAAFAKFRPSETPVATRIDFTLWDEALEFFVFRMGRSIREGAPSVSPGLGTRRVYGHESRFRLEGNRVAFSYLEDEVVASLTDYRKDLENTASLVDIATLARNEQLAYWINLHNVAVIEQIALNYPLSRPASIRLDGSDLPMDETPFITVAGVAMSPKDIRTKIVYPNWNNPKVIYGFFRGEIGGPSIQSDAYSANNVARLLEDSADEFINSLRGTSKSGDTLKVSQIYEEARPFFFPNWEADLKDHLLTYSDKTTTDLIEKTAAKVDADIYEFDIADLSLGEKDPNYSMIMEGDRARSFRIPANIARLLGERGDKIRKAMKRNNLEGLVTVIPIGDLTKPVEPDEVE